MTIEENKRFVAEIEGFLSSKLPIKLGVNKRNELVRLIYEICRARHFTLPEIIKHAEMESIVKSGKDGLFHKMKTVLLKMRYPSLTLDGNPHLMPIKLERSEGECAIWDFDLKPKLIFIEKDIRKLDWTQKFIKNFANAEIIQINNLAEGFKELSQTDLIELYNARREYIFLTKNKSAFIKKCPCTKRCKRCGYWILNIGFGCPVDCSYCYLQMYSNAPGIVLSANIEEYYSHIEKFDKNTDVRARIGTGEFTDSLALDKYTNYSSYLIPFFKSTKNLILELKTKIGGMDNVLKEEPHENVVISWSMNTRNIAERYEKGGENIGGRIKSALLASQRGYKIGFHFDPLVYYKGWESDYKGVIEEMFSFDEIRKNTVWISLGTLRYTPGLKQAAEQRFSDSVIFYQGEFFVDEDGKFRYPRELRIDMYNKIIQWIRSFKVSCWIYLCMEPEQIWKKTLLQKNDYLFR